LPLEFDDEFEPEDDRLELEFEELFELEFDEPFELELDELFELELEELFELEFDELLELEFEELLPARMICPALPLTPCAGSVGRILVPASATAVPSPSDSAPAAAINSRFILTSPLDYPDARSGTRDEERAVPAFIPRRRRFEMSGSAME